MSSYYVILPDSGPNRGLEYFTDVPFRTETFANVNYAALQLGSDFYQIQESKTRRVRGVLYCSHDSVPALLPQVEAHEGTDPPMQPNSHIGIYLSRVQSIAGPRVEPQVGQNSSIALEPIRAAIHSEALAASAAMDTIPSPNNLHISCEFHYDYSGLQ